MRLPARARALSLATLAMAVTAPLPLPASALDPAARERAKEPPVLAPVASLGPRKVARKLRRIEELPRPRLVFPVRASFNWGQGGARYGAARGGRSHEGQDVMARAGSPLVAITDGIVLETGNDGGRGNHLAMFDPRAGLTYVYLHMQDAPRTGAGGRVRAGDPLGAVGCTGSCFGDHLHLEVRRGRGASGAPTDPLPLLSRALEGSGVAASLPPGAG